MKVPANVKVLQTVLAHVQDLICILSKLGEINKVSQSFLDVLGYERAEVEGRNWRELVHPESHPLLTSVLQTLETETPIILPAFTVKFFTKSGQLLQLSLKASWVKDDQLFCLIGQNSTCRNLLEQELLEKEKVYRAMMENGADMFGLLDEKGVYLNCGGSITKVLGYSPEELIGQNAINFIHPEDLPIALEALSQLLETGYTVITEFRFKSADNDWVWLETIGRNHLQTPAIQALVLNSRDVTERVRNREQLQHSERRFRALFENNPDMVLIENQEGEILEANPAFIKVVKLTNEQLVGKKITDFLPAEAAQNCAQELEKAFQGEQVAFEIDASFEGFGRRVLHITKIPVIVQQHVTAVYSVIKDVTEASLAQKTIQEQVEKVRHVFESITDAFFAVDRNWNFTIINGMFEQMMNVDRRDNIGKNLWDAFPQKKSGIFHQQYSHAFDTGTTVQFEAFLKELGIWVEVKAFPSEEGLSVYLSNVTEKVEAKQELEKLSLVASRTINGVIITDAAGKIEWVNNGFSKLTGYTLKEVQGQKTFDLLFGPETNPQVVQLMALKLKQAIPVSEELLHYKKNGEKVWLAIDVTPVTENGSRVSKYIYIQTDVTLRKEMEASQQAMTEDLFQRNRDLQQFTYIVSHNLRAPVANALGLADLLTKIDRQSELFDLSLANLKKSVFKLDTILRDLNLVLSIRDKREIVEKEEVGVADVWEQAYQNFQELLINCGGQVQVEIEPGLTVKANRAYLFSIFYNLLSNAIKYRAEDRPLLIRITAGQFPDTGKQVVFSDNGSGFDQEKAGDQVFKLYKRFHVNKKGRGIGLFLVKTQVEALGGEISVESQVGKGTRFQINLK